MPGLVSPATLEQIRAASDIVEVIGSYLPLKRAGANFVTLCPFHKEKSPSFNVHPQRQIFHCFGCHKGGDVFTFVQEYDGVGFAEAIRRLAERARIPLEFEKDPAGQKNRFLKDALLQIHEQITQRWQAALANDAAGQIARDYLAKRGVSDEAVKLFRLGYAPEAWDDTVHWAKAKGHDLPVVEQAGLILRKEGSDRFYDRFRGRLIFPICDEQGRVIAFSGRVLGGDEKTAKYVNSPETPIFTKGRVLFALDKAKRAILDHGFAVVCEGQLDTIACHTGGVPNAVAPQGTALTAAHAGILRRYTDDIILCFDGDAAGQRAAARAFDDLLAAGIPFRVASIPAPDDPDSYLKKFGREPFVQLLVQSDEFHGFYLKFLCSQHDIRTDRGRQQVVRLMGEALQKTGNAVLADTYAQKTAQQLGVRTEAVRSEFSRSRAPGKADAGMESPPGVDAEPRPSPQEFWLLKLLALDDGLLPWAADHLNLNWVRHAATRRVVSLLLEPRPDGSRRTVAALLSELDDAAARALVTEAAADQREISNRARQLEDLVKRLRDGSIDQRIAAVAQRLNQAELSDQQKIGLLHEQQELRKSKREPLLPREPVGS